MYNDNIKSVEVDSDMEQTRTTQIDTEMLQLREASAHLKQVADMLVKRLTPVMAGDYSEKNPSEGEPIGKLCPLAESIRTNRKLIDETIVKITNASRRLEI